MSDPSSQPTLPLTDEQRFELWRAFAGGNSVQYFSGFQDQHWTAGVDRLAAVLAPMLDGEYEKVRNENKRLRADLEQARRIGDQAISNLEQHLAALDQSGEGQANA